MIILNEHIMLLPLKKRVGKLDLYSTLLKELLLHVTYNTLQNHIQGKIVPLTIDLKWLALFDSQQFNLIEQRKRRQRICWTLEDIDVQKQNYYQVTLKNLEPISAMFRYADDTFCLDQIQVTKTHIKDAQHRIEEAYCEVKFLYDGTYWCRFEEDFFGNIYQIVRHTGEEYYFSTTSLKKGYSCPTLCFYDLEVQAQGESFIIGEYFKDRDFDRYYREFKQRVKDEYKVKLVY